MDSFYVKTIKVTTPAWYEKGKVYKVRNYVVFDYKGNFPSFEAEDEKGIKLGAIMISDCEILHIHTPEPSYTMKELIALVGHKFKLIIEE